MIRHKTFDRGRRFTKGQSRSLSRGKHSYLFQGFDPDWSRPASVGKIVYCILGIFESDPARCVEFAEDCLNGGQDLDEWTDANDDNLRDKCYGYLEDVATAIYGEDAREVSAFANAGASELADIVLNNAFDDEEQE